MEVGIVTIFLQIIHICTVSSLSRKEMNVSNFIIKKIIL